VLRQFADVTPANVKHQATAYRILLNTDFSDATVTTALTPLTEESDVTAVKLPTPTYVDLTPLEYGFGTVRTLKLNNRGLVQIDPIIAEAVAFHMVRTIDGLVQTELAAGSNQVYGGTGNAAANDLAAGDVLTAQMGRYAVSKFQATGVAPRYNDGSYAAIIHPYNELTLRTESGSGGWRTPNEYGASQERIWSGEIGKFEGLTYTTNPRVKVTANTVPVNVYKTYYMGKEALASAVNVEPEVRIAPVTDRLSRFAGIGWYGDLDFGVFRQSALIVGNTTLTADDATALA
jgi:N4-gp56 family major capsid protein